VSSPRFSLSAICHIYRQYQSRSPTNRDVVDCTSPRTRGSSRVFSKNLTATSPVTTPMLSVSACRNSWPNTRFSSGVRFKLGAAMSMSAPSRRTTCDQFHSFHQALIMTLRPIRCSDHRTRSQRPQKTSSYLDRPPSRQLLFALRVEWDRTSVKQSKSRERSFFKYALPMYREIPWYILQRQDTML
jgi:hypothetical protein